MRRPRVIRTLAKLLLLLIAAAAAVFVALAPGLFDQGSTTEVAIQSEPRVDASEPAFRPTPTDTPTPTLVPTTDPVGIPLAAEIESAPPVLSIPEVTATPTSASEEPVDDEAAQEEPAGEDEPTATPEAATPETADPLPAAPASTTSPPNPEPTATATTTPTPVPTATPAPTATPTPTAPPTATPVPTATPLPTATPVPTATPLPTATPTPTAVPVGNPEVLWVDSDTGLLVRTAPAGTVVGTLAHTTQVVTTGVVESAAGWNWTQLSAPMAGWVAGEFLSSTQPVLTPTPTPPTTGDGQPPTAADWAALRNCESGGNYSIVSPNGLYHGAYQFSRATWDGVATSIGRPDLVGVPPSAASPADQDQMALALYAQRGAQPWPHCGRFLL
ncbi:MAG: transglycosylase family protein [Actinomycetota bacterium]